MNGCPENVHKLLENRSYLFNDGADEVQQKIPKPRRVARAKTAPAISKNHQPDTARFLRKNQTARKPPLIDRNEYKCVLHAPRPPVPKEVTPATARPQKNFIKENVRKTQQMEAKPPAPVVVVSCKGDRHDLTNFLEARKLRESNCFGQVPKYLIRRRKSWTRMETVRKAQAEKERADEDSIPGYRQVSDEERQTLLKVLKERWMEVHKEFQVLPVLCDTAPKVKRKLFLERQLGDLEKDMELLNSNPIIYIHMSK